MSQVASTYANALYSLAREENAEDQMLRQLDALQTAFSQEPAFIGLLSAPELPKQERCRILDDSFREKVHPYVLNFMKLLTEKGYMRHFSDCCKEFHDHYNRDHGILPVRVMSAVPMSSEQTEKLKAKLSAITGKTVELRCKIDPSPPGPECPDCRCVLRVRKSSLQHVQHQPTAPIHWRPRHSPDRYEHEC